MAKQIHDNVFIGEDGIAIVQRVLYKMRYAWQATGKFDAGIDGYIELRDARNRSMLGAHLGAQVKARRQFTAETDESFEFLCEQEHIDYWMRSNIPVLLICVHPETDEAWFVCVTEYFLNPSIRAGRRVFFDKRTMRFDASIVDRLRELALPTDAGVPRRGLTGPETLLTNLLPLVEVSDTLWSAPTECQTSEQANARYALADGPRASDYLLRENQLYSLRDPGVCELARLCEASRANSQPSTVWSASGDRDLEWRFADLLRRTLLQQLKPRIRWQPDRALFYFAPPFPLHSLKLVGPTGRRRAVVDVKWFTGRDGKRRVSHVRHQAFSPRFVRLEGQWYLQIEPDWYFSWNGTLEDRRADERLRFWKARERNNAVSGHLRLWEQILCEQSSGLDDHDTLLRFGPLRTERAPVGIDDKVWRPQKARPAAKRDKREPGRLAA